MAHHRPMTGRAEGLPAAAIAVIGLAVPWASAAAGDGVLAGFWTPALAP